MRIEIQQQGGFAATIRQPPLVIDTDDLEPDLKRELEQLATALPPAHRPPPGGADLIRYDVVVDGRGTAFFEPDVPPAVRRLVKRAREVRRDA